MGKITNLKESPQYIEETLQLIENCFEYNSENNFDVDFYPLFNERNFENCHILIENEQVIAHIGCLQKTISLKNPYTFNMFGGIAVHSEYQGQGIFRQLFNSVLEKYQDVAMSFLWSDKLAMYEKFNFFPCVGLVQYHQTDIQIEDMPEIEKTKLDALSSDQLTTIKSLYSNSIETRPDRSDQDWEDLKSIISCDLFLIKEAGEITNYFIQNKGQDLINIVHEYGSMNERDLKIMITHGDVWTPHLSDETHPVQQLYGSVGQITDEFIFEDFLKEFSNARLVELKESEITVQLEDEEFSLSIKDFLPGLLGPNRFNEIEAKTLFISGLDSI